MPNIGPLELAALLVIVLLIFGPKRLPGLGKQLGTGMREFKDSITGKDKDDNDDAESAFGETSSRPAVTAAPVAEPLERAAEAAPAAEPQADGDAARSDG